MSGLTHLFFPDFIKDLAVDTECCRGARFQPLHANLYTTGFTKTKFVIVVAALTLIDKRTIPVHAKGFQCVQDVICCPGYFPWRIQVFHAQQPVALVMACVKITADGRDE